MLIKKNFNSNNMNKKILFIVWWNYSRRGESFAEELGAKLFFINLPIKHIAFYPIKLIYQLINTFIILIREKPDLIFVQNPPIFLTFTVYLFVLLFGVEYVIDNHNGAFGKSWEKIKFLTIFLIKKSKISLVHNEALYKILLKRNYPPNKIYVIEDKIPDLYKGYKKPKRKHHDYYNLTVVSSLSPEENIREIVKAVKDIYNIRVQITGKIESADEDLKEIIRDPPKNVKFTGFLPDNKYWNLLDKSDIILVFDERENILCCGGYEAISLMKPLIIVDNNATREYFGKNVVYISKSPKEIKEKINYMIRNLEHFEDSSIKLKKQKKIEWGKKFNLLKKILELN